MRRIREALQETSHKAQVVELGSRREMEDFLGALRKD
jgi:hypothetical protein